MKKILLLITGIIASLLFGCGNATKETTKEEDGFNGYKVITLTGKEKDHYIATDFCYIESDKYFIFLEKDVDIPGNFKVIIDEIVDELENTTGLTYSKPSQEDVVDSYSVKYGYNPWKNFDYKGKFAIYIKVDKERTGYVSGGDKQYVDIYDSAFYSLDFWQNNPKYSSQISRREENISYRLIAHEMTHTLTTGNFGMNKIMTEGGADYFAGIVMDKLKEKYGEQDCFRDNTYMWEIDIPIDETNAEKVFTEDFSNKENEYAPYEYTLGKLMCMFLKERIGEDFFAKYGENLKKYKLQNNYGYYDENDRLIFAKAFKETYGDNIFEEFGKWYKENASDIIEKQHNW